MGHLSAFFREEDAVSTVEIILILIGNGGTSIKSLT